MEETKTCLKCQFFEQCYYFSSFEDLVNNSFERIYKENWAILSKDCLLNDYKHFMLKQKKEER